MFQRYFFLDKKVTSKNALYDAPELCPLELMRKTACLILVGNFRKKLEKAVLLPEWQTDTYLVDTEGVIVGWKKIGHNDLSSAKVSGGWTL